MESFDPSQIGSIVVLYTDLIKSPLYSALCKQTAQTIINDGYISFGDWLKNLHPDDLQFLLIQSEDVLAGNSPSQSYFMLIVVLLQGEGEAIPLTGPEFMMVWKRFAMQLSAESLSRKGVATFHREHATLAGEVDQAAILTLNVHALKHDAPDVDPKFPMRKK